MANSAFRTIEDELRARIAELEAENNAYRDLERKCEALEADYVISNRELLIKQVEINRQSARIAELEAENDRLQDGWFRDETICPDGSLRPKVSDLLNRIAELSQAVGLITTMKPTIITELEQELNTTDGLLKEATETIGAVVACCTYNSNDDAKIGIYGIDQKAFTRIDQFMTHYNDAISAGKVSVDVKRELTDAEIEELGAQEAERKEFCPNCEAVTPCTHEAELFVCDICGEDFAKYIVSRKASVPDVSTTQDVLIDIKTPSSIENNNPDYYKQELARIAEFSQAVGLITTLKPTMVMDAEHPLDMAKEAAEYVTVRIAELEEKQRWRVVADGELPEVYRDEDGDFIPFLVCEGDGGNPFIAMYNGINWWAGIFVPDITHWMPLPELPEVQE